MDEASPAPEAVRSVLASAGLGVVRCVPLAGGRQARLWRVTTDDTWDRRDVVVKLYRGDPAAGGATTPAAAREEWESLRALHAAADGRRVAGWRVAVPRPIAFSTEHRAIVMSPVWGRPAAELTRDVPGLDRALLGALVIYWGTTGRLYGDMNLRNVLVGDAEPGLDGSLPRPPHPPSTKRRDLSRSSLHDPVERDKSRRFVRLDGDDPVLTLLDPGAPEPVYACPDVAAGFAPASRDLAFLLFDTAAQVRTHLVHPRRRRAGMRLATRVVALWLDTLEAEQRDVAAAEVRACVAVHLRRIETRGVRGLWRRVVWLLARRGCDRSMNQAKEVSHE